MTMPSWLTMDNGDLVARGGDGAPFLRLFAAPAVRTADGDVALDVTAGPVGDGWTWRGEAEGLTFERTVRPAEEAGEAAGPGGAAVHVLSRLSCRGETALVCFQDRLRADVGQADYVWTPALAPEDGDVVGDHAWRSPLLAVRSSSAAVALVPDLDVLGPQRFSRVGRDDWRWDGSEPPAGVQMPGVMNMVLADDGARELTVGLADYAIRPHVFYRLTGEPVVLPAGHALEVGYDLLLEPGDVRPFDLRGPVGFLWRRYAPRYLDSTLPQKKPFATYSDISYRTLLATGDMPDFQTPEGAPAAGVRTVSTRLSRDVAGSYMKVPPRSVFFLAWWNSLRTAFGLAARAQRLRELGQADEAAPLADKAQRVLNLIRSAPDATGRGWLPDTYDFGGRRWWGAATRLSPVGRHGFCVPNTCHTAQWLLLWHRYLEPDEALLDRPRRIAQHLLELQDEAGAFPGYLDAAGKPAGPLARSGHAAAAALLLCELHEAEPSDALLAGIERACRFLIDELMPRQKWQDFEVFYSCASKPLDWFDHRTGQNAQNTLSIYWAAETLLRAAAFTGRDEYLAAGRHCLDHLSLHQQVWNATFLKLYTFGGFCTMNGDGEWNDMRQPMFSQAYFRAYLQTHLAEDAQRARAALRSGYALFSHPDHADLNPVHYDDYAPGYMAENYAHSGDEAHNHRSGFDWGGGSLATYTALTRLCYGDVLVDADHQQAFGIDGCRVTRYEAASRHPQTKLGGGTGGAAVTVQDEVNTARTLRVVLRHAGQLHAAELDLPAGGSASARWSADEIASLPPA